MLGGCIRHPMGVGPVALPHLGPQGPRGTLWLSPGRAPSSNMCWVPQDRSAPLHPWMGEEAVPRDGGECGGKGCLSSIPLSLLQMAEQ